MVSLGQKAVIFLLPVVLVSVLAGCGGADTKPVVTETDRPVEHTHVEMASPSTIASQPEKNQVVETAPLTVEKAESPAVEIIPHKASAEAPIDVTPLPVAPVAIEPVAPEVIVAPEATAQAPIAAPPSIEPKPAKAVPVSAAPGANEFVITVGTKGSSHPMYGKGHVMGFMVDGVPGKELVFERGKTYRFDIRTDPKHDVYLSSKDIGWGGAPIAKGVEGAFTYKGVMTFTPDSETPDVVYYACRNHPYMGAAIHIVEPGGRANILARTTSAEASVSHDASSHAEVTEAQVKQRLMFADMMANSEGSKRVTASNNAAAKKLLGEAKQALTASRANLQAGQMPEALALADGALSRIGEASRLVPSDAVKAQQVLQYQELLAEIADYESSHEKNLARISKKGAPPEGAVYDKAEIAKLKAQAKASADQGEYVRANADLQQVQHVLTTAIHKMLDSQTIVYDLNFETPADEYEYELKRFTGYEELIPVAIEAKKPTAGSIKLMESFLEKARSRREEAKERAAQGAYGDAIEMMQQATTTVRRALRMVGVTQ